MKDEIWTMNSLIVVLTLTWVMHGHIERTHYLAPDWDTCVRWRLAVRSSQIPEPGVALITGCQWRLVND